MVVVVAERGGHQGRNPQTNLRDGNIRRLNSLEFPSIGSQPQRGHAPTYIPTPPPAIPSEQVLNATCSICLDTSADVVTGCKHSFHMRCLDDWYKKNKKCPNCNGRIDHFYVECSHCNTFRVSVALSAVQPSSANRVCMDCLGRGLNRAANESTFDRMT
mgnify:CR=1 FL=1